MTHTLRAIFQPLVSTLYGASKTPGDHETGMANRPYQKIRTIELDGKTVKLQIVSTPVIYLDLRTADVNASGIPQAKSDFVPSHPPITAERTASALSTM